MAAGLTLFQLGDLPTLGRLSGRRLFNEQDFPYELEASAWPQFWSMEVHQAAALGGAARNIVLRFKHAVRLKKPVNAGAVFRRQRSDTGDLIIDLGIADGETIYLQMFGLPRATLQGEQAELALMSLFRFGADTKSIRGAGNAWGLAQ